MAATVISFALGGDYFVDEAINLGNNLGLSKIQTGATFLSFLSITDEFFVVLNASFRGYSSLSFGAIQGSNLISMFALLIIALILGIRIKSRFAFDSALMILIMVFALVMSFFYNVITMPMSIFLIILFLVYFYYISKEKREELIEHSNFNLLLLIFSAILIFFSSNNLVTFSDYFFVSFGKNLFFWGLLLAGIAGSIPETIMFLISIERKEYDSASGLILSSSIYKATILLALAALISPLAFTGGIDSIILMIVISFLLFVYTIVGNLIPRKLKS
ncbi:MAG: sodium:calcium antiporter [Thermoplasmataceae archaeon]